MTEPAPVDVAVVGAGAAGVGVGVALSKLDLDIQILEHEQVGASTATALSPVQVLVVVYLAGVLLPCLVTAFTVAREVSARWALKMVARQAVAAVAFAVVIAWSGALLFG